MATTFAVIWSVLLLATGMISLVGQRAAVEFAADDRGAAVSLWSAVSAVHEGLGGGIELVGAVWILLLGLSFPR